MPRGLRTSDHRPRRRRSVLPALAATVAVARGGSGAPAAPPPPPPAPPPPAPGVDLLGFSDALSKTTFADTTVGGLSALAYDARRDVYYSLVDNQPGTPARFYTLRAPLAGEALGTPEILAVTCCAAPTERRSPGTTSTARASS